jgi:tripartite-type tricarboxylate transporter receptor subunit TctC
MPISRRNFVLSVGFFPAASLVAKAVYAAGYPDHPIRMVVPFNAGGNVDAVARIVGAQMTSSLGQTVVIDNRAGAGGSLGASAVVQSLPDGYTILAGSNGPLTANPFVFAKIGYKPLTDLAPIAMAGVVPHVIMANNKLPAKTVQELVALSKTRFVSAASAGIGSATHLTLARFNAQAGAKLEHVPYRGGNSQLGDLVGGAIDTAVMEFSTALPIHRGGKARIIAVGAATRSPLAPDVQTFIEGGLKDFTALSYVGFLAPARTQPAVIERLRKSINDALAAASTVEKMQALGIEMATAEQQTPAGFAAFLRMEFERSQEAAKLAGIKPE